MANRIGGVALGSGAADGKATFVRFGPSVGVVVEQPAKMAISAVSPSDLTEVIG